jgi:hypothetical protein
MSKAEKHSHATTPRTQRKVDCYKKFHPYLIFVAVVAPLREQKMFMPLSR